MLSFVSTGADVSFPLIAALSAYIAVTLGNNFSLGVIPIFIIAIGVGCLIGCINGFFIVKYKFNSLIVTLGTSSICSGILFGAFEAGRAELPDKLYKLSKINIATVTKCKIRAEFISSGYIYYYDSTVCNCISDFKLHNGRKKRICSRRR